ncbi:MAG: 50S ribosomal protein L25 [Patescibacteria group bacterium]
MPELSLSVKLRKSEERNPLTLRKNGLIPAVLYGPETENQVFTVDQAEFLQFLKSAPKNKPFRLKILDSKAEIDNVLIHEIQKDSLKDQILNIDFYQFSSKKRIKLSVPIEFIGKAPAIDQGGVIVSNMNELEVECLPINIPEKILVDVSVLENLDSTIYVKDLNLPGGVVCHFDPQTPVVSVTEPTKEVVAEEPVAAEEAGTGAGGESQEEKTTEAKAASEAAPAE